MITVGRKTRSRISSKGPNSPRHVWPFPSLQALFTSTGARVEGDRVWLRSERLHLKQETEGSLPLLALLAIAAGRFAGHREWPQAAAFPPRGRPCCHCWSLRKGHASLL